MFITLGVAVAGTGVGYGIACLGLGIADPHEMALLVAVFASGIRCVAVVVPLGVATPEAFVALIWKGRDFSRMGLRRRILTRGVGGGLGLFLGGRVEGGGFAARVNALVFSLSHLKSTSAGLQELDRWLVNLEELF